MIDIRSLQYDGRQRNHQNGLVFYFTNQAHVLCFLIDIVGDRKRKIKVTMQPDINHRRPHIHIDEHNSSFAVDTGELLAGECDNKIRRLIEKWIEIHREDLIQLWDLVKRGVEYQPVVRRIRREKNFEEQGFKGKEPQYKTEIDGVVIWHDDELLVDRNGDGRLLVVGTGDLYVAIPDDYPDDYIKVESLNGRLYETGIMV